MTHAGILIYGGTFNPVHIGHLRAAIEARQKLSHLIERVEFLPSARHPQKTGTDILPFNLRVQLLKAALAGLVQMTVCEFETQIRGLSYTFDILANYPDLTEATQRYFLLGSSDYELLPTWYKGMELPSVANLVVIPRGNFAKERFLEVTAQYWPGLEADYLTNEIICIKSGTGTKIFFLSIPWLQISATAIRQAWLKGDNIDYLTPKAVEEILRQQKQAVTACWNQS